MLTVLLVRHGETVHNVAQIYAGITDSEYHDPQTEDFFFADTSVDLPFMG